MPEKSINNSDEIVCDHCGKTHPKGTKFCPHTGELVPVKKPPGKKTPIFIIIPAAAVAIAVIVYFLFIKSKVNVMDFRELKNSAPQIAENYENQMNDIGKAAREKNSNALGEIGLNLTIDENGKINIKEHDSRDLKVTAGSDKNEITDRLLKDITGTLKPKPQGKDGKPLRVTNFQIKLPLNTQIEETTGGVISIDYTEPGIKEKYANQLNEYKRQLRFLEKLSIKKDRDINRTGPIGQIQLRLTIDKDGNISIQGNSNYETLEITPEEGKNTVIEELRTRVQRRVRGRKLELQKDEQEKLLIVKNFPLTAAVKVESNEVEFVSLPGDIRTAYLENISDVKELILRDIGRYTRVSGEVNLRLTIDEQGTISIQEDSNYDSLTVTPEEEKQTIIEKINHMLNEKFKDRRLEPIANKIIKDFEITVVPVNVIEIEFIDLAPEIKSHYRNQLESMGEISLRDGIQVSGQIRLRLTIDEQGKITIQEDSQYTLLRVTPGKERERIIGMLKSKIAELTLDRQKNAQGALLKVKNFPITAKVIQTENRIIIESVPN